MGRTLRRVPNWGSCIRRSTLVLRPNQLGRRSPRSMNLFLHTEAGGHPLNEDHVLARAHPADAGLMVCLLADGMGGRPHGAAAARAACEAAWRVASAMQPAALRDPVGWWSVLA